MVMNMQYNQAMQQGHYGQPIQQGYYNQPMQQGYYNQSMQNNLEQRLQQLQNQLTANQSQNQPQTPQVSKLIPVNSIQEAQNAQIPMDGTVSYFVFGDTILAKNWSFATGKIENVYFKKAQETAQEESKPDKLAIIDSKLDQLLSKYKESSNTTENDSNWIDKLGGKKNDK